MQQDRLNCWSIIIIRNFFRDNQFKIRVVEILNHYIRHDNLDKVSGITFWKYLKSSNLNVEGFITFILY